MSDSHENPPRNHPDKDAANAAEGPDSSPNPATPNEGTGTFGEAFKAAVEGAKNGDTTKKVKGKIKRKKSKASAPASPDQSSGTAAQPDPAAAPNQAPAAPGGADPRMPRLDTDRIRRAATGTLENMQKAIIADQISEEDIADLQESIAAANRELNDILDTYAASGDRGERGRLAAEAKEKLRVLQYEEGEKLYQRIQSILRDRTKRAPAPQQKRGKSSPAPITGAPGVPGELETLRARVQALEEELAKTKKKPGKPVKTAKSKVTPVKTVRFSELQNVDEMRKVLGERNKESLSRAEHLIELKALVNKFDTAATLEERGPNLLEGGAPSVPEAMNPEAPFTAQELEELQSKPPAQETSQRLTDEEKAARIHAIGEKYGGNVSKEGMEPDGRGRTAFINAEGAADMARVWDRAPMPQPSERISGIMMPAEIAPSRGPEGVMMPAEIAPSPEVNLDAVRPNAAERILDPETIRARAEAHLEARGADLERRTEGLGARLARVGRNVIDRYNELHWGWKLAASGVLVGGAVLANVAAAPVVAGYFAKALLANRALGAVGMSARIHDLSTAENPRGIAQFLQTDNPRTQAAILGLGYFAATFAIGKGAIWAGQALLSEKTGFFDWVWNQVSGEVHVEHPGAAGVTDASRGVAESGQGVSGGSGTPESVPPPVAAEAPQPAAPAPPQPSVPGTSAPGTPGAVEAPHASPSVAPAGPRVGDAFVPSNPEEAEAIATFNNPPLADATGFKQPPEYYAAQQPAPESPYTFHEGGSMTVNPESRPATPDIHVPAAEGPRVFPVHGRNLDGVFTLKEVPGGGQQVEFQGDFKGPADQYLTRDWLQEALKVDPSAPQNMDFIRSQARTYAIYETGLRTLQEQGQGNTEMAHALQSSITRLVNDTTHQFGHVLTSASAPLPSQEVAAIPTAHPAVEAQEPQATGAPVDLLHPPTPEAGAFMTALDHQPIDPNTPHIYEAQLPNSKETVLVSFGGSEDAQWEHLKAHNAIPANQARGDRIVYASTISTPQGPQVKVDAVGGQTTGGKSFTILDFFKKSLPKPDPRTYTFLRRVD